MTIDRPETPVRVAVVGGAGYLGAHAVATLALAARLSGGGEVLSIARTEQSGLPAGRAAVADALRAGDLEGVLERERPSAVLLVAALARGSDCDAYPGLARALNVELPGRVARWCAGSRARLVHVSTDLVFGSAQAPPGGFAEDHPTGPLSAYGASKADGERAVLAADPDALVVRLPLLYGDSGGRGRGASDALLEALARGERPPLFTDEWRTPLEVRAAARALAELLLRPDAPRGLLHVAGPERVSRLELGLAVLRARGLSDDEASARVRAVTRADAGLDASRPRDVSLDCARARALLATRLPDLAAGLPPSAR